jgi:hypothetical protein
VILILFVIPAQAGFLTDECLVLALDVAFASRHEGEKQER